VAGRQQAFADGGSRSGRPDDLGRRRDVEDVHVFAVRGNVESTRRRIERSAGGQRLAGPEAPAQQPVPRIEIIHAAVRAGGCGEEPNPGEHRPTEQWRIERLMPADRAGADVAGREPRRIGRGDQHHLSTVAASRDADRQPAGIQPGAGGPEPPACAPVEREQHAAGDGQHHVARCRGRATGIRFEQKRRRPIRRPRRRGRSIQHLVRHIAGTAFRLAERGPDSGVLTQPVASNQGPGRVEVRHRLVQQSDDLLDVRLAAARG
jgi:hypothetical protein